MPDYIIVTRHPALLAYIRELSAEGKLPPLPPDIKVIPHASPEQIEGKIVIGVLPMHLAAYADEVWEVELDIPPELRGKELTLDQVREFARGIHRYRVQRIGDATARPDNAESPDEEAVDDSAKVSSRWFTPPAK